MKTKKTKQIEQIEITIYEIPDFKTFMMIEIEDLTFSIANSKLKTYLTKVFEEYDNQDDKNLEFIDKFLDSARRGVRRDDTNHFLDLCFCLWLKQKSDKINIIY